MPLTLGEAVNGAQITIPTLGGDLRVTIPPGSANGATLRLRGKGAPRADGSTSDLYLVLRPTMPDSPNEETKALAQSLDEQAYSDDVRKDFGL